MHYDLLVTQLVSPLWSVRIAEKERRGLLYPCAILVDTKRHAHGELESYPDS